MKIDFTAEEHDVLFTSLIRSRIKIQEMLKIVSDESVASYTRELHVVEAMMEKVSPGSVDMIRLTEKAA